MTWGDAADRLVSPAAGPLDALPGTGLTPPYTAPCVANSLRLDSGTCRHTLSPFLYDGRLTVLHRWDPPSRYPRA